MIAVVLVHKNHKTAAITGCVASTANGMSLTDEKYKRVYTLSGDPVGREGGERMTLEGKRANLNGCPSSKPGALPKISEPATGMVFRFLSALRHLSSLT